MKFVNPYKYTQLDKVYSFAGNLEDFKRAISYCEGIRITKIYMNQFRIESTISVGVLIVQGMPSATDPINVTITVSENENAETKLHFTTDIRSEHYFVTIMFILLLGGSLYVDDLPWFLPLVVLIAGVVTQWWFYFILRTQETAIADDVLKKLKIFELHYI